MIDIILGNAIDILRTMKSESIHCCITSPPYWGLRKYDIPDVIFDGDEKCKHEWVEEIRSGMTGGTACKEIGGWAGGSRGQNQTFKKIKTNFCSKCSAWRGQLGLEPTPSLYVKHLVEIFREVKRVLRKDGTLWLNLGDAYFSSGGTGRNRYFDGREDEFGPGNRPKDDPRNKPIPGLKPKDLVGIPWMVAFALRDDGWYLRSDIIWSKPNPMPESVTDRPTKAHEYIFLLSKNQKYYFDQEAVREQSIDPESFSGRRLRNAGKMDSIDPKNYKFHGSIKDDGKLKHGQIYPVRNIRTVWTIPTQPYSEAHFATFPEKLVEPMIKAGCPIGGTILDPFAGSGTVLKVAEQWGRNSIGIDLGYIELMEKRTKDIQKRLLTD